MIWIVIFVLAVLMFKLGVLSVIAAMLSVSLKVAIAVILLLTIVTVWLAFKVRRKHGSIHTLRKDQWRQV